MSFVCSCCFRAEKDYPKVDHLQLEEETDIGTPFSSAGTIPASSAGPTPLHSASPTPRHAFAWADEEIILSPEITPVEEITTLSGRRLVVLLSDDQKTIRLSAQRTLHRVLKLVLGLQKNQYHLVIVDKTEEAEKAILGIPFYSYIYPQPLQERKILTYVDRVDVAILDNQTRSAKKGEELALELLKKMGKNSPVLVSYTTGTIETQPSPFHYDLDKPIIPKKLRTLILEILRKKTPC